MKRNLIYYILILLILLTFIFLLFSKSHNKGKSNAGNGNNIVTDIDGNTYNPITIGKQIWLSENLKTTRFNDSTNIINVKENTVWAEMKTPAFCWYNNDLNANRKSYGALYNWNAVKYDKLCPKGWHVPGNQEWSVLIDYLGGESTAGGKLKESEVSFWDKRSRGTNESGFSAVPSGYRYIDGIFHDKGRNETWWSSTETSSTNAFSILVNYGGNNIYRINYYDKNHGFSVRCIRDSI
jgi:uncharacterized protein (TIGR02145 family)